MPSVFDELQRDHRQVEHLLERLSDSEEGTERDSMIQELTMALELHMEFEEREIYPMIASALDQETSEEANNEHQLAREGTAKLQQFSAEPGFGAVVDMVKGGIGHHVEDEESEIFPALRRQMSEEDQRSLAEQLATTKQAAGMGAVTADTMTKDELYDKAKEAGVPGRSSMTKEELASALEPG